MIPPRLADLRALLATERVREAMARAQPPLAAAPVTAVRLLEGEGVGTPNAPASVRKPFVPGEAHMPQDLPGDGPTEAVEVSGRARWLSALDTAGETLARAATTALRTVPEGPVVASPEATTRLSETSAPVISPASPPPSSVVPAWLPASLATVRFDPGEPEQRHAASPREPGTPARPPRARLTAFLDTLGQVDIDVCLDPAGARVVLVAEARWHPALQAHVDDLAQALEARGIGLAAFEVRRD